MSALLKAAEDACRWLEARCLGGEADAIAKELRKAIEREVRAIKAEQEVAEWKRRFDLLLARTPKQSEGGAA